MLNIKRILVPVDFSDASARALAASVELAERFGASVDVLHVIEIPSFAFPDPSLMAGGEAERSFETYARGFSEKEMTRLLAAHPSHSFHRRIVLGNPAITILDVAKEGFDLVVMSTHGRTGLTHLLIGSVTEKVVRKAPCAVLTTR